MAWKSVNISRNNIICCDRLNNNNDNNYYNNNIIIMIIVQIHRCKHLSEICQVAYHFVLYFLSFVNL